MMFNLTLRKCLVFEYAIGDFNKIEMNKKPFHFNNERVLILKAES
jgi:hypothetical protein